LYIYNNGYRCNHYCILLCWISPWTWPKKVRNMWQFYHMFVYSYYVYCIYSAVVGIITVTCLTARKVDNLKFVF
jgi:hypothetical protein